METSATKVTQTPSIPLDAAVFGQPSSSRVDLLQTHIGCVYLVGEHAFKLKKHVRFDFLDFSSLEQRRWACDREVQLNRRLCPRLYMGIVPVIQESSGRYRVELQQVLEPGQPASAPAAGECIVDFAVWMKRLPTERMLDALLDVPGAATENDARAIAGILAPFYKAQRGRIAPGGLGDLEALRGNIDENIREGRALDRSLLAEGALALIEARARGYLERHAGEIRARANEGFIVDGHGDLRAENICLPPGAPPCLFDCIEFNDRFRVCDSALDVAYLAMDLDARGREDLSAALLRAYRDACDPELPERLLNFYLGYRAFVKAKVGAWIAADAAVDAAQRAQSARQARAWFDLAVRYALQEQKALLVFCGPAGSGKSTLAAALAARLKCAHFATDEIRAEILPKDMPREQRYKPENSYRVYRTLKARARQELAAGRIAVADGTFTSLSTRKRFAAMARESGAAAVLLWADCPPEKIAAHLAARTAAGQMFGSEAGAQVSKRQRANFERPLPRAGRLQAREGFAAVCRVDTGGALDAARDDAWNQALLALALAQALAPHAGG